MMMNTRHLLLLFTLSCLSLFFCTTTFVSCWGFDGHKAVATVAYRLMSKSSRNYVDHLTMNEPVATIAAISDDFGHAPNGKWSKNFHFINIEGENSVKIDLDRDCKPSDPCIVLAIRNYTQHLREMYVQYPNYRDIRWDDDQFMCPAYPWEPKDVDKPTPCALAALIHFVGDVHQPLHSAGVFDFPFGGNTAAQKCTVEFRKDGYVWDEENVAIHVIWDAIMINFYKRMKGYFGYEQLADDVYEMIRRDPSMIQKYGSEMDPVQWAQESFDISKRFALNFDRENRFVNQSYYDQNMPIIFQRLATAGIRLAVTLQQILDQPSF